MFVCEPEDAGGQLRYRDQRIQDAEREISDCQFLFGTAPAVKQRDQQGQPEIAFRQEQGSKRPSIELFWQEQAISECHFTNKPYRDCCKLIQNEIAKPFFSLLRIVFGAFQNINDPDAWHEFGKNVIGRRRKVFACEPAAQKERNNDRQHSHEK